MPIDASIPLQVNQPQFMSPAQAMSLQQVAQQRQIQGMALQQAQQDQQERNALRQLLPQAIDPATGALNPQKYGDILKAAPIAGQKLIQQNNLTLQHLSEANAKKMDQYRTWKNDLVLENGSSLMQRYDEDVKKYGPDVATRNFAMGKQQIFENARKTGEYPPEFLDQLERGAGAINPEGFRGLYSHLNPQFAAAEKAAKQPLSDIGKVEADFAAGRISAKDRDAAIKKKEGLTVKVDTGAGSFEGRNGEILAALAEKGVSLPAGFRSKSQQLALLNSLSKRNPDLTADQIAEKIKTGQIDLANQKIEGKVAAGIAGKIAYAENEIEQTIPLVREASANLPRGEFVPWNKLRQMGEKDFSNPDLAEFRAYMTSLSNAYDMLAARGGTDVEKRAENRKLFDTAQSPEALERVLKAVQKEAQVSGAAARKSMDVAKKGDADKPAATGKLTSDEEKELADLRKRFGR